MSDPTRWRDAPDECPEELRELLGRARAPRSLPPEVRRRGLVQASRLASVPVVLGLSWIGLKTAAAAMAVTTVVATAAVVLVEASKDTPRAPTPSAAPSLQHRGPAEAIPAPPELPLNPQPEAPSDTATPSLSAPPTADFARQTSDSLAEETHLLERARSAVSGDPGGALVIVREHAARFPSGRLSAERTLIEIQALQGLGRQSEARALGERVLERSPRGLYADRVRRLIGP